MKTAEEIFEETYSDGFKDTPISLKLAFKEASCKVAKLYANQKLDESSEKVTATVYYDKGCEFAEVDINSILSLKDKV